MAKINGKTVNIIRVGGKSANDGANETVICTTVALSKRSTFQQFLRLQGSCAQSLANLPKIGFHKSANEVANRGMKHILICKHKKKRKDTSQSSENILSETWHEAFVVP